MSEVRTIIGIDASRARSGGAKAHLLGILGELLPNEFGILAVHVWADQDILDKLPSFPWLVKHCPACSARGILSQLLWQRFGLPRELYRYGCHIVLNLDAGTVNKFSPSVTMSRDMLSYELGEMQRYGFSKARWRLWAIKHLQAWSLRRANSAVFLTQYASEVIQEFTGALNKVVFIPHGIGSNFSETTVHRDYLVDSEKSCECIYVSNLAPYKHQWHVAGAVQALRRNGYNINLTLIGDDSNDKLKKRVLSVVDPSDTDWLCFAGHVRYEDLPEYLARGHIFVFASSCENMPNSLIEAMAVGLPIASSDRGPMPEILGDGGLYFDPEDEQSIAESIGRLIKDESLRDQLMERAKERSKSYSWERCSRETFRNLIETRCKYVDNTVRTELRGKLEK